MAYEGKFEQNYNPLMKMILTMVLDHEIDYFIQGFQLELFADYECAFALKNLAHLYELMSVTKENMLKFFMDDLFKKRKIEFDGDEKSEFRK